MPEESLQYVQEIEVENEDLNRRIAAKLDEFLDVYSFYLQTGIIWIRDELRLKAYELHLLDPQFAFRI